MIRFYMVIITCFFLILYYVPKMAYYASHRDVYSEEQCYQLALTTIEKVKKHARIKTEAFGVENLPREGGYVMYSNHQGKYDALGIMSSHEKACTVVMDYKRSKLLAADQFISLLEGQRLQKDDIRQQVHVINQVAKEVKEGRRYLLFPEGGYSDNQNTLQEFNPGSFKIALRAKRPIVPIAIFDSYKPFSTNSLRTVITQVHFLTPIPYEDYKDMSTIQIRDVVVARIQEKLTTLHSL